MVKNPASQSKTNFQQEKCLEVDSNCLKILGEKKKLKAIRCFANIVKCLTFLYYQHEM